MHSKDALVVFIIWPKKKIFFHGRGLFGVSYVKGFSEADLQGIGHLH